MTAPKGSSLTYLEPDVSSTSSSLTSESVTSSSTFSQRRHRLFVKSNKGCVDVAVINRFDDDRVTLNPFVEQAMEDEDAAEDAARTRLRCVDASVTDARVAADEPLELLQLLSKEEATLKGTSTAFEKGSAKTEAKLDVVEAPSMKEDHSAMEASSSLESFVDDDATDFLDGNITGIRRRTATSFLRRSTPAPQSLTLTPPPGCSDFVFQLESDEGVCDLFDIQL